MVALAAMLFYGIDSRLNDGDNRIMALTAEQYLRPDVIRQVSRLDLKAQYIVEGLLAGLHRSPYHGFSVEFSEHRKYTPGEDIRHIDWKVYGRTDRYYIKKYQAETNLEAYLLVDTSASMDYSGGGRMTKLDYSLCLAAALGYMMVHQQDSVGLVTFDEGVREFLPPRSTRQHLSNLLATLSRARPESKTHLAGSLHEVARRIRRRSLMVLLSDLLSDQDAVIEALHHLHYRGHDVIVFQVMDHSERTFDFDGQVRFEDPESTDTITADPKAMRAGYLSELNAFVERYRECCHAISADFVVIDNAMNFDKALVEFLLQREGRF